MSTSPGRAGSREPIPPFSTDAANPLGIQGVEFIEFAASRPQALGRVLAMMGFELVAMHRSREVALYRQGDMNLVVNATATTGMPHDDEPRIAAIALRVGDAQAASDHVIERGAWGTSPHPGAMELNIPAVHGVGGSRIYFVDRWRDVSIYDVDFLPLPTAQRHPPAIAGAHWFGIVQYVGVDRSADWTAFYRELFAFRELAGGERFGVLPRGTLLRSPASPAGAGFMIQLVEPRQLVSSEREMFQRIGIGVPDVPAAVRQFQERGVEFLQAGGVQPSACGAVTRTYLGSVMFELVRSIGDDRP
ncbi:MAG: 4-hydroxyphenylpyruvate dioxygenase [Bordetella sp. SCN 67-23]|nr:4-hydroxyphenylpyruvate dioxygenase [Burkholderiales bacterium]ODS71667.1 MAG: 4-hydroxyphenylpyruvate dioxygenase [Bordetella sp. SCN 67-23]OJW87379.1 MAG: 4-hydroxyphenylpyruvate dioxygenase [Burkholderiales bacterium 67-32]